MIQTLLKKEVIALLVVIIVISYAAADLLVSMNEHSKFQKSGAKTIDPVGANMRSQCEVPIRDIRKSVPPGEKFNHIQIK